uniref:Uncharacterized protein n=1 Tax=Avena sativa TaxID=4498 RepID=A0ACD5ZU92_AVESA
MEFPICRTSRSYVRPCGATPSGVLELSSIDRAVVLRHQVRSLHVFPFPPDGIQGSQPGRDIRGALGQALVDYYPFAGRLVGGASVECTGEGVWFVEAATGCCLDDVGFLEQYPLMIPEGDLLPDAPPGVQPLDIPLMMQVTVFSCGGYVVGLVSVHTIADGVGISQFMSAVGDYSRSLPKPRINPIFSRGLIPRPAKLPPPTSSPDTQTARLRQLTFEVSADHIRRVKSQFLESTGQRCSALDVVTAMTWQARTRSLRLPTPSTQVSLCLPSNTRHLVEGGGGAFVGNCFYPLSVAADCGTVSGDDTAGVVRIIREAKARLPAEFARWAAGDSKEDPYQLRATYDELFVTDWTNLGFLQADYGMGKPSNVIPLAFDTFLAAAIIYRPAAPKDGARIMTQCVKEDHFSAFLNETNKFGVQCSKAKL